MVKIQTIYILQNITIYILKNMHK